MIETALNQLTKVLEIEHQRKVQLNCLSDMFENLIDEYVDE